MPMPRHFFILAAIAAVLALPTQAYASNLYAGQYGAGGTWNIYELWPIPMTWADAYNYIPTLTDPTGGTATGHLATIADANENAFLAGLILDSTWIGLTDREGVAPNAEESQTFGSPGNQTIGWAWVDGTPFTYQSWNTSEPNDSGGEDAIELLTSGLWNDNKIGWGVDLPVAATLQPGTSTDEATGVTRVYMIEWEVQSSTEPEAGVDFPVIRPLPLNIFPAERMDGPRGSEGMLGVREVRANLSTPTIVEAVTLVRAGLGTVYDGEVPTLDLADPDTSLTTGAVIPGDAIPILSDGHDVGVADDNNIQTLIKGRVYVPAGQGGAYSVQFHSDDGFALRFLDKNGNPVPFTGTGNYGQIDLDGALAYPNPTGDSNSLGVIVFEEDSVYDLECVAFENGGGAFWEMTMMQGDYRNPTEPPEGTLLWTRSSYSGWQPLGGTSTEEQSFNGPAPAKLVGPADVTVLSGHGLLTEDITYVPGNIELARDGLYEDYTYESTITTIAMQNNGFSGLGSAALEDSGLRHPFPNAPTGGDIDNFETGVTGQVLIDDGDDVSGETLELTFALLSDDNSYFEITGVDFIDVVDFASDPQVSELYDANANGTTGIMFNAPTGNSNTLGLINIVEGQYDFEAYMLEIAGGAGLEIWVAEGNYLNVTPSLETFLGAFWPLTTIDLTQFVEGATVLQLVDPDWIPGGGENADFNGDGVVNGPDFLIWQIGLGLTGQTDNSKGDANGDGVVDGADLGIWQSQFGAAPPSLSVAIPEPATYLLMALVVLPWVLRRRG